MVGLREKARTPPSLLTRAVGRPVHALGADDLDRAGGPLPGRAHTAAARWDTSQPDPPPLQSVPTALVHAPREPEHDMTHSALQAVTRTQPAPAPRRYLMCPPDHFAVTYSINPWMNTARPVNRRRAWRQWDALRRTYLELGHRVDTIDPEPGLPDMVFAANGGLVIDRRALGARFVHPERAPEGPAYLRWLRDSDLKETFDAVHVNEGEGDFLVVGDLVLAGTGFRTRPEAH